MIIDRTIFDFTGQKNLGRAYNEAMAQAPDDSHVILRDGDTCWLTPDYGIHIAEYIRLYPDAVLTCWTNRINAKAEQQLQIKGIRECKDMGIHLLNAEEQKQFLYQVCPIEGFVSGFCLVVPKKVWQKYPFPEKQMYDDRGPNNLLGVDNFWTNEIRRNGIRVLRMEGIMIYHTYRMLTNSNSHLL